MHFNSYRLTYIAGFIGAAAITLGALITGLAYTGTAGERYSPLNHWVSELGEVGVSEQASVFNLGLIIGGLALAVFLVGLASLIQGRLRYPFALLGLVVGISGMLVGVFPMNDLQTHSAVSLTFFNTGWIAVAIFTLYILIIRPARFPAWLMIPGIVTVASFIGFLLILNQGTPVGEDALAAPSLDNRPDLWLTTVLEWMVIIGILAWSFLISLHLWRSESRQAA